MLTTGIMLRWLNTYIRLMIIPRKRSLGVYMNHPVCLYVRLKSGSRGGTGGPDPPPPLGFVRDGVLCGYFMGRRGGPKVVLSYFCNFFWLAYVLYIMKIFEKS